MKPPKQTLFSFHHLLTYTLPHWGEHIHLELDAFVVCGRRLLFSLYWYLTFTTTFGVKEKWSLIGGGLKIKGYLHWMYGVLFLSSGLKIERGLKNRGVVKGRDYCMQVLLYVSEKYIFWKYTFLYNNIKIPFIFSSYMFEMSCFNNQQWSCWGHNYPAGKPLESFHEEKQAWWFCLTPIIMHLNNQLHVSTEQEKTNCRKKMSEKNTCNFKWS